MENTLAGLKCEFHSWVQRAKVSREFALPAIASFPIIRQVVPMHLPRAVHECLHIAVRFSQVRVASQVAKSGGMEW